MQIIRIFLKLEIMFNDHKNKRRMEKIKHFNSYFFALELIAFRFKWKIIGCRFDGVQPRINQGIGRGFACGQDKTSIDAMNR